MITFQAEFDYAKVLFKTEYPTEEQLDFAAKDLAENYLDYLGEDYETDES